MPDSSQLRSVPSETQGSKPRSRIPAVFLDWAGTVVDHGSVAPVKAIEDIFAAAGRPVSRPHIRKYVGLAKRDHIRKLLEDPVVTAAWPAHPAPTAAALESLTDHLYAQFQPRMMERLAGYAQVIPGAVEVTAALRARGIKIAGTTGYTRAMLDQLETLAAAQGYSTDRSLTPEAVGAGRPHPYMCFQLAIDLRIYPLAHCVKIGDTPSDIEEGLNASMWTIGLTRSGNSVGLTESEWLALDPTTQSTLLAAADRELRSAGAHFTAETIAHVLPVLDAIQDQIEDRIGRHITASGLPRSATALLS
jgi:phosphonoacetaldehyde hydrolase